MSQLDLLKNPLLKSIRYNLMAFLILISLIPTMTIAFTWLAYLNSQTFSIISEYGKDAVLDAQANIPKILVKDLEPINYIESSPMHEELKTNIQRTLVSFRHVSAVFLYYRDSNPKVYNKDLNILDVFMTPLEKTNAQENINNCLATHDIVKNLLNNQLQINTERKALEQGLTSTSVIDHFITGYGSIWTVAVAPLQSNNENYEIGVGVVLCANFLNAYFYKAVILGLVISFFIIIITILLSWGLSGRFLKPYTDLFAFLQNIELNSSIVLIPSSTSTHMRVLLTILANKINTCLAQRDAKNDKF